MSMAIAHFALGATLTALLVTFVVPRTPYSRVIVVLGGVWAMVPDLHWVLPAYRAELRALSDSIVANVFWFHPLVDAYDAGDSKALAAALIGALVVATAVAEHRNYHRLAGTTAARGRVTVLLARAGGLGAVGGGLGFGLLALVEPRYTGLSLGIGTLLGVNGVLLLRADARLVALVSRHLSAEAIALAKVGLGVAVGGIAVGLLTALETPSVLSVGYAGLALLLFASVLRLWLPAG